jgi:hypothetical protein
LHLKYVISNKILHYIYEIKRIQLIEALYKENHHNSDTVVGPISMRYTLLKDPSQDLRLVLLKSVQLVEKSGCLFNGKPIEIICEIHSFSYKEKPQYFALSYPCGGKRSWDLISPYILVNGLVAKIGGNLALALRTLLTKAPMSTCGVMLYASTRRMIGRWTCKSSKCMRSIPRQPKQKSGLD